MYYRKLKKKSTEKRETQHLSLEYSIHYLSPKDFLLSHSFILSEVDLRQKYTEIVWQLAVEKIY